MEKLPLGNAVSAPSGWSLLPLELTRKTVDELLDGGQAFRWNRSGPDTWRGIWSKNVVEIHFGTKGELLWRALTPRTTADELMSYLGQDADWSEAWDTLPWRSDPVLKAAMQTFAGLRILRQPVGETLLAFLCSSNKQIVQIKAMLEALSGYGQPLTAGLKALPTWQALAALSELELRNCKLGYRARFIYETAHALQATADWENKLLNLPYPDAKAWLCTLPGVGPKVADCVLLFGAAKLEAFPIDTWIERILCERYGLAGWSPKQLLSFSRVHFGPYAGLAQQFLFAAARAAR